MTERTCITGTVSCYGLLWGPFGRNNTRENANSRLKMPPFILWAASAAGLERMPLFLAHVTPMKVCPRFSRFQRTRSCLLSPEKPPGRLALQRDGHASP